MISPLEFTFKRPSVLAFGPPLVTLASVDVFLTGGVCAYGCLLCLGFVLLFMFADLVVSLHSAGI